MALDVRTMYMAVAAVCFINAATLSIVLTGRSTRGGTVLWTSAWVFQGCAWVLTALRGFVWDFISIPVCAALLAGSFSLFYAAIREHQGRPYNRNLLAVPAAAGFLFCWYFSAVLEDLVARTIFMSALFVLQLSAVAWTLFRHAPAFERRSSWLTGFAFLIVDMLFSGRLAGALALPPSRLDVLAPLPFGGATLITGLGAFILMNIGFLLMTREKAEAGMRQSEEHYRFLFDGMLNGYAYCRMLYEGQEPKDFIYIDVNPAFETLTGLRNVTGKKVSEVIPGFPESDAEILKAYGRVARSAIPERFEVYVNALDNWFAVSVYSPRTDHFVAVFDVVTRRKRIDEALRESEEQYRLAIECSADGVAIAQDNRYVLVNRRYIEMFGYRDSQDIANIPVDTIVHPDDLERVRGYILKGQRGEPTPSRYEFKGITKDGRAIDIEASTSIISYGGKPAGLGYFRDVTEQKRAQEALLLSRQRMALHVEQTPLGIVEWDVNFFVRDWNPSAERIFGYGKAEALGRHYSFVLPVSGESCTGEAGTATGLPLTAEKTTCDHVTRDGRIITCEWFNTKLVDHKGHTLGISSLIEDVTERKKAEREMLAAELKYRIVADNTYDWEFWSDPEGRFVYVSPACEAVSGYPPAAFLARSGLLGEIVHQEDRPAFQSHLDGVRSDPRPDSLTFRIVNASGEIRWIEHVCRPVWSEKGEFLGVRGNNRDITDRMRLEEQLRQAQKMEAVGTLAGGVAHDFNNLLTVIMGFSTLIQAEIGNRDHLRPYIDQVLASSEKAAELTQRLLAFSRKQHINLAPHNLNDIVTSTAKLLKRLLTEDIALKLEMQATHAVVEADPGQIDQVLMNLATNARDAMPKGGSLTIRTEEATLDAEFCNLHEIERTGRYVLLAVSDSGVGMDERTMGRIFDPFFTTKDMGKGTGLGLASVYGIISQHKGYITVTSEPGRGTTFLIYLPLLDAAEQQKAVPAPVIQRGTETVLVAEDEHTVRRMLTLILEAHGYTVLQAVDGEDAVRLYRENREKIDLVVLDVVMPVKNGKEALDEIARIDPKVRAIFVSGYTGEVMIDKGVHKESVDFLQKPVSVPSLLHKVREVLDR